MQLWIVINKRRNWFTVQPTLGWKMVRQREREREREKTTDEVLLATRHYMSIRAAGAAVSWRCSVRLQ